MKFKKIILIMASVTLFIFLSSLYFASNLLLYRRPLASQWDSIGIKCVEWYEKIGFADLKKGGILGDHPLERSCTDSISLPSKSFEVASKNGSTIHMKVFDNLEGNAKEDTPIFLHVHGITSNWLHGARYFNAAKRLGFRLVSFDLTNHGMSTQNGRGAGYGCLEHFDLEAVVDEVIKMFPNAPILVSSSSMGTMVVANALPYLESETYRKSIRAYLFESPVTSLEDILFQAVSAPPFPSFYKKLGFWLVEKRTGVDFKQCAAKSFLNQVTKPSLIVHTQQDELVPTKMAQNFYDTISSQAKKSFKLYPKGAHSAVWNGQPEEFEAEVKKLWGLTLLQ